MPIDDKTNRDADNAPSLSAQLQDLLGPKHLSDQERMFFTEQLVLLLETGGNLHDALTTLEKQAQTPAARRVVGDLAAQVSQGKSFSSALAAHPDSFDSVYINLVSASEEGGFMPEVLRELLAMDEKKRELANTLMAALSYPLFLLGFSLLVVIFVLVNVFPKFGDMFESIRDELPGTTIAFLALSDILLAYWIWIVLALAALVLGGYFYTQTPHGKALLDGLKLRTPGINRIFIELYMVQLLRVMGLSLRNGVSLPDTLRSCAHAVDNREFHRFIADVENTVVEGGTITAGFARGTFVPPLVKHMVQTGEAAGKLAEVMSRIADFYERELTRRLQAASRMAEPLMLVVMGVVVGLLVSSLILPIFKLSSAVN